MRKNIRQKGLSLIELLVAMLVSSVILMAIMELYVGLGSSSKESQMLSSTQDKANFALNELARQIRMSGAGLCAKPKGKKLQMNPAFSAIGKNIYKNVPLVNSVSNFSDIRLHSYASPTQSDIGGSLPIAAGSDALVVSYSSPLTLRIVDAIGVVDKSSRELKDEMMISRYHGLKLSSPLGTIVKPNDPAGKPVNAKDIWLMVSDCDYTEVVYYSDLQAGQLAKNELPVPERIASVREQGFKRKYYHSGQTGMVASLESKIFFVADGSDGWALYEKDLLDKAGSESIEVMDGVKNMKIEYLHDTGWQSTAMRTDWSEEVPVKISLTMDEGGEDGQERIFTRVINPRN